jgi:hypothetical protein
VAQACNPSYMGGGDQEYWAPSRPIRAKSLRDRHLNQGWAWWCEPVIPATKGSTSRRFLVQASLGINARLRMKKIITAKRAGGVA